MLKSGSSLTNQDQRIRTDPDPQNNWTMYRSRKLLYGVLSTVSYILTDYLELSGTGTQTKKLRVLSNNNKKCNTVVVLHFYLPWLGYNVKGGITN